MSVIYINSYQFAAAPPVGPTDPDFASVSLLLHGDGANGSTTIVDSSPNPKTVTAFGNAQISTAVADPFGNNTGVIAFDGNGDYLTIPDNNDFEFGAGDFTLEAWIYITGGTGTYRTVLGKSNRNEAAGVGSFVVQISNTNTLQMLFDKDSGGSSWDIIAEGSTPVAFSAWHHVAVVRFGNVFTAYLNGQSEATATNTMSLANNPQVVTVGALGYTSPPFVSFFSGYIDDLRITKGVARYTSNFTPPTAPFPDA